MKKHPSEYTKGEVEFAKCVAALKAGAPNAYVYRKNVAVTEAGDFIIGLIYNTELRRYSCTAIEIDGVRDNGKLCTWDAEGGALEADLSDLRIESVHEGVSKI